MDRFTEPPHEGPFCDMMWSDPEEIDTWAMSPRGAGWLFGKRVVDEFNHLNGLDLICRAHQLVQEGYKYMFSEQLVTVWSAPNYCYRCGNVAAVLEISEASPPNAIIFSETEENRNLGTAPRPGLSYFL
jgi:serine/threonine-protein phosphatase 6 catalytic subunit